MHFTGGGLIEAVHVDSERNKVNVQIIRDPSHAAVALQLLLEYCHPRICLTKTIVGKNDSVVLLRIFFRFFATRIGTLLLPHNNLLVIGIHLLVTNFWMLWKYLTWMSSNSALKTKYSKMSKTVVSMILSLWVCASQYETGSTIDGDRGFYNVWSYGYAHTKSHCWHH